MKNRNLHFLLIAALALTFLMSAGPRADAQGWKAGAAKVNITPGQPMWMSGYASRSKPAEGKLTDLWAKALVLEDPDGQRAALITLDLIGLGRPTSLAVRDKLAKKHRLARRQIAICCSHTHTGPVVGANLKAMYFFPQQQWTLIEKYTQRLQKDIVAAVDQAMARLAPCRLSWGVGQAGFAVNRRENKEANVPELRKAGQLKGPIDHDAPVLRVVRTDANGKPGQTVAVVFGYACHATVLSFYEWSGDYPGFAQIEVERAHPGAVALFWAGCGGDQNPLPRRKVELAKEYGARLAQAVEKVLDGKMQAIDGKLTTAYEEIDLSFADLPNKKELEINVNSRNRYESGRAKLLLAQLERDGKLSSTYPYPVQVWRLGKKLRFVTLGGEVVVDYSLRIKQALGADTTWVAGYANDVMAYIPSRRVLAEGGYEGARSMVYYGQPTVWAPELEEQIIRAVRRLAAVQTRSASE